MLSKSKQQVSKADSLMVQFAPVARRHAWLMLQVGMIRLSGFNARAQQDVAQAIKALTQQGAAEFILDVRDNRGGLYQEGAEVAKLFLEGKLSVLAYCETGNYRNYDVMQ